MQIVLTVESINYKNLATTISTAFETTDMLDIKANPNGTINGNTYFVYEDTTGTKAVYTVTESTSYIAALTQGSTINYDDSHEDVTTHGAAVALSIVKTFSFVTPDAGGDGYTLADGVDGQVKYICLKATAGGTATITPANLLGYTTITLTNPGESVQLKFMDTKWNIVGGNAFVAA